MSLWACIEHGLTGPMACCGKASLAAVTAVSQVASRIEIDYLESRIRALEAELAIEKSVKNINRMANDSARSRIEVLEAALRKIARDGRDHVYQVAASALDVSVPCNHINSFGPPFVSEINPDSGKCELCGNKVKDTEET